VQFDSLPDSDHPLVALRPIEQGDLPVWLSYLQLPVVYQHTSWNNPTLDDLSKYVWSPAMRDPANLLRLAIVPANRSAELAFDLTPGYWGRGIATHVCELATQWAHKHAGVLRVQATALESNARSVRVLERAGFNREGLLRCYRLVRGRPGNFLMYSHLAAIADVT
jgi:ribosomal-protein-alanine N-acetyltransferase